MTQTRDQLVADTEDLVRNTPTADQRTFLSAQFDAGLAWVHHPLNEGGLGVERSLQQTVDETLERHGRLASWQRNPMGIGMCAPAIAAHGNVEQRTRHLRSIFLADELWCQLFSEPGAGSDVATLSTRAVLDGDEWTVNGQKVWTSWGRVADFGLLIARTDPDLPKHAGLTAFLVDMRRPGVEVRPLRQMTGEASFCEVYLNDLRLPDSARLGAIGDGWKVAITTLMNERVSIGGGVEPRGSGPIAGALDTWARTPAHTPVQRDRLSTLWIRSEALRLTKLRFKHLRSSNQTPGPEGSLLKLGAATLEQQITNFVVDLMGSEGMLAYDYGFPPVSRADNHPIALFLWSPSNTIAGGTTEIMKTIIGDRILELPREPSADHNVPWRLIPRGA